MIRTLKITTWLSVIAAILAIGGVGFYSLKPDVKAKQILAQPGEVELFLKTSQVSANKEDTTKDSPLVRQAEQFALRLDPPPPPPPPQPVQPVARPATPVYQAPPPSATFSLTGTVVSPTSGMSIALIDTTAKGKRWYRIGEKIGRHEIAEIHPGYIVINDGTKTYEMKAPPKTQKPSLLKSDAVSTAAAPKPAVAEIEMMPAQAAPQKVVYQPAPSQVEMVMTAEQVQENIDFITQLMNDPESMGLSKEEAASLGDMSEFVEELKKDMAVQIKKQDTSKTTKAEPVKQDSNTPKPPRYEPRGSARTRQ